MVAQGTHRMQDLLLPKEALARRFGGSQEGVLCMLRQEKILCLMLFW